MSNIFTDLVQKLTRRQKKNKPVPVPVEVPEKVRQEPAKIGTVVTYNRVDGRVSGSVLQVGGVTWDDKAKVYRGKNYVAQQQAAILEREAQLHKARKERERREDERNYASSTTFDDAFFYQSTETGPERVYTTPESSSGYDYPSQPPQAAYVAPSPSYEPSPSYSPPSYSSPSYSDNSSSSSSSSSSSYSDSGSSSSGGGYGGGE